MVQDAKLLIAYLGDYILSAGFSHARGTSKVSEVAETEWKLESVGHVPERHSTGPKVCHIPQVEQRWCSEKESPGRVRVNPPVSPVRSVRLVKKAVEL
jgi:hypothetical protein